MLKNFYHSILKVSEKLRRNPITFYLYGKAFIKGCLYVAFYRLFRNNVAIKLPFLVYHKVKICGPGSVFIDKHCSVFLNTFDGLTILTFSPNAQVIIGRKCNLGGMTIHCHNKVIIGDYVMAANCLLKDTLIPATRPLNLRTDESDLVSSSDIYIGNEVWLSSQTIILGGSKIEDGSVLSIGSMCFNRVVSKNHLASGNPVSFSLEIEKIKQFFEN